MRRARRAGAFHMIPRELKIREILTALDRLWPGLSGHVHGSQVFSYHPAVGAWISHEVVRRDPQRLFKHRQALVEQIVRRREVSIDVARLADPLIGSPAPRRPHRNFRTP